MTSPQSLAQLCTERSLDARQLAAGAGVDEQRIVAILMGRWTPSPEDRDRIAGFFGLTSEQIMWGHTTPVQHLYGAGPA